MKRALALLVVAALGAADALAHTSAPFSRSAMAARSTLCARAPAPGTCARRPSARVHAIMADESGNGLLEGLKRRGAQLARDLADAAERAGEALDEGLDAVLGPQPSSIPRLIPIPIPVEPDYRGRGAYGDYGPY